MAMAIQCGQKLIQQLWTVRHCAQTLAQSPRRIQPVANLAQVPWAAPPRHNTAKRARIVDMIERMKPAHTLGVTANAVGFYCDGYLDSVVDYTVLGS